MNEDLSKTEIIELLIKNGKVNSRIVQLINNGHREHLRQSIVSQTSFLDNSICTAQRIWHIFHNVDTKRVCASCGSDKVKFLRFGLGYQPFCGTQCASKSPERLEKTKNTVFRKYGVTNIGCIPTAMEKRRETNIRKYGTEYPLQNKQILQATHSAQLAKYGDWGFKSTNIQAVADAVRLNANGTKQGNYLSSIHITPSQYDTLENTDKLSNWHNIDQLSIGEIADIIGVSRSTVLRRFHQQGLDIKLHYRSSIERTVSKWITEMDIPFITNDRTVLKPQELDIVLPDHKVAIELNGLWYHSERVGFSPTRHREKTDKCLEKGYRLVQLYDYEVLNYPEKCKDIIRSSLNANSRIAARKLQIVTLTATEQKTFFDSYHMQGCGTRAPICFGLTDGSTIIAAMSFGTARYDTKSEYELMRYATKSNNTVVGGASRLFAYFIKIHNPQTIVSYCDRRLFTGNMYNQLGFTHSHDSRSSYWYFKFPITKLYHRSTFQKHTLSKKLAHFDPLLTEWENMVANGWNRVWDSGTAVYHWSRDERQKENN